MSYAGANGAVQAQYVPHDDEVLNGSLGLLYNACVNEYHYRWWDDTTHAALTNYGTSKDRHGAEGQFVIGGVHFETRAATGKHHIARDWYLVRNQSIHYERGICSMPRYLYNPAGDSATGNHLFQGHRSDGWIGYLSLHLTPNCP